ncbi:DUF4013 domain-containing protein [bacterium]|nr:DUF4013 domain-containing protein [bacterium]
MSTPEENPFASPETSGQVDPTFQPSESQTVTPRISVDYLACLTNVFENPNWLVTVLILGFAPFVPILGGIIALGYVVEIIGSKAYGRARVYPDFDFNRFMDYLVRGLWVFAVLIVVSICYMPIMFVGMGAMMAAQASRDETMMVIGSMIYFGTVLLTNAISFLVSAPFILRAGLLCDFMGAFDLSWVWSFIRKMWLEQLIGALLLGILGGFIMLAGCMLLCIGSIPAMGIVTIMMALFNAQLYQVFVHRGGQPLEFKPAQKL